jgi:hypothetical protein
MQLTSSALRLAQLATEISELVPLAVLLQEELDRQETLRMRWCLHIWYASSRSSEEQQWEQQQSRDNDE